MNTNIKYGAVALLALTPSLMHGKTKQPNVIVILADDLGMGDVSAYGSTTISTPNIDLLANEGIRFDNAYATSATSTPSRFALMTGLYPWRVGARVLPGDAPLIIDHESPTLPKLFQEAGYTTAAIGKWHLGMGSGNVDWNQKITPGANDMGFDYSCLIAATNDRVPTVYVENGHVENLDPLDPITVSYKSNFEGEPDAKANPELLKMEWSHGHNAGIVNGIPRIGYMKGGHSARWVDEDMADYFVAKVKNFIEQSSDEPFFLYYGLHQPHVPRAPHSRFVGATTLGPRGDAIIEADWCIGELLAMLEEQGILENTMIVFSSDNGAVLDDGYKDGAIEMLGDHTPSNGMRSGKYSLFDGGTHVPFMIYWKGELTPAVSDALVCQFDLVPSFAQMLGVETPEGLDAENMLPAFMGESLEGRESLITEAVGRLAYRTGDWALIPPYGMKISNAAGNEPGNFTEYALFNLKEDKGQIDNLGEANIEIKNRLIEEFEAATEGYEYTRGAKK